MSPFAFLQKGPLWQIRGNASPAAATIQRAGSPLRGRPGPLPGQPGECVLPMDMSAKVLDLLEQGALPGRSALVACIDLYSAPEAEALRAALFARARAVARACFGRHIFVRGLVEFTNICRKDCYYCGIRRGNARAARYRMSPDHILACCVNGWNLGFRTFVLQGGEDPLFSDDVLAALVARIKAACPESAVTLSVGERSAASYAYLRRAGADRYLLRHETADATLYARLHPADQTFAERVRCLHDLKHAGYQTGAGMMVGLPGQTTEHLAKDLEFLYRLRPEMVGIGPFIPHNDTPLADFQAGSVARTLVMLALARLMLPRALLPATTALGTAAEDGREKGILAGANVLMPNVSPRENRKKYMLYNGKLSDGDEAAENMASLRRHIAALGYEIRMDRGDYAAGEGLPQACPRPPEAGA